MTYNHVTLVGNLVKDPEYKESGKSKKASFTLAVERYIGKDKKSDIDYFNVEATGNFAGVINDYLKAGSKVLTDGKLEVRKTGDRWETIVIVENIKFLKKPE